MSVIRKDEEAYKVDNTWEDSPNRGAIDDSERPDQEHAGKNVDKLGLPTSGSVRDVEPPLNNEGKLKSPNNGTIEQQDPKEFRGNEEGRSSL